MNTTVPIMQVEKAVKAFRVGDRQIEILNGIDLDIYAGESLAIMGPSGAGKSTLLHVLGLLTPLDSGSIRFMGHLIQPGSTWDCRLRSSIGFIFQDAKLIPNLTVMENVCVPLAHRGVWPERQKSLAREALELVGLEERLLHHPAQLSGGEMMRVSIARALVFNPVFVLVDEPTGNLDSKTGEKITDLLLGIISPDRALVIVTHHKPLAMRASRIVFMKDGQLEHNAAE
jgi:putative ABC transport system ATP-binding protein